MFIDSTVIILLWFLLGVMVGAYLVVAVIVIAAIGLAKDLSKKRETTNISNLFTRRAKPQ